MNTIRLGTTLGIVLLIAVPLFAHHPFSAEFDQKKTVTLSAVVTKFDWGNPHAYLHAIVPQPDGTTQAWSFEMGSVVGLKKAGWTKTTVRPGDMVTIEGWLARSKSKPTTANMKAIRLPDGRELSAASSNGSTDLATR